MKREMNLQPHQVVKKYSMPEPNTGCWLWIGRLNDRGYGALTFNNKKYKAHRFSYEALVDTIPEGKLVCHKCDVPSCVNPQHLFIGTTLDNINDKVSKRRHRFGSKVAHSKLTEQQVTIIRETYNTFGRGSQPAIGRYFGICQQVVSSIVNRKIWKHI